MNTIILERDILKSITSFLSEKNYSRIAIIVDENTLVHCYNRLGFSSILPLHNVIEIKSGEEEKNLNTCQHIWQKMTEMELDRKSLIINLGGGVIGDMGGFCASTYKRGIDFIQIPTTLLAMVDASVGGKLGIDFNNFKNHIGVFNIPTAVLISVQFLDTLPVSELKSGFGEVIKHCLINDRKKWEEILSSDWNKLDLEALVKHSIKIKDEITVADPTEKGIRKTLNFGHTLGHAIETFYLNTPNKLLHGEAIAIGMICESFLSLKRELITKTELEVISNYIISIFSKFLISTSHFNDIIHLTKQDKKNEYSKIQFSLIGPIGECGFNINVTDSEMEEALSYYNSL